MATKLKADAPGVVGSLLVLTQIYEALDRTDQVQRLRKKIDALASAPTTPGPVDPPAIITSVRDILDGNSAHTVVVAGALTGPTSDSDEWNFSDGTGSVVLDFPSSGHIPAVGVPIYVLGRASSSEIDVEEWMPQG